MTVPTYAMGLALVVAIGYFAYNAFFGEDEQQQGHQNRERGEQYRNQQDEQEARHRRQRGEVRQRRQREDDSRSGR